MDANEGASRMGHEGGPHLASRPGAPPWCTVLGVREDRVGECDRLAPDARYDLLWRAATAYLAALAGLACLTHALVADGRATLRRRVEPATVPHSPTREEATR